MEIEQVMPIIKNRAAQFMNQKNVGMEFLDLVQEGVLLFLEKADTYDVEKGAAFSTWFYRILTNRYNTLSGYCKMRRMSELPETIDSKYNPMNWYADLSEDASAVLTMLLERTWEHSLTKGYIRSVLYQEGWSVKRVNNVFEEIQMLLR